MPQPTRTRSTEFDAAPRPDGPKCCIRQRPAHRPRVTEASSRVHSRTASQGGSMTTMQRPRRTPARRAGAAIAALGVVLAGSLAALGPGSAVASSHREAPLVAADPAIDNTDVYAFESPDRAGYVTFVANWIPFEEPNGGPNFYPFATDAAYNIYVDNNGDAKPDATFRWTFHTIDKRGGNTFLYN